jgi:hypothetical protein
MASSPTDHLMTKISPLATMLMMPLRNSVYQVLLTDSAASWAHDRGASGLVTSMPLSSNKWDKLPPTPPHARGAERTSVCWIYRDRWP